MGTLMELKGPISPSVTCVRRRVPWGQSTGITVFLREFPTSPLSRHYCKDGCSRTMSLGCPFGHNSSKAGPILECLLIWSPNRVGVGRLVQAVSCLCALHRLSDCHRDSALFTSFRTGKDLVGADCIFYLVYTQVPTTLLHLQAPGISKIPFLTKAHSLL